MIGDVSGTVEGEQTAAVIATKTSGPRQMTFCFRGIPLSGTTYNEFVERVGEIGLEVTDKGSVTRVAYKGPEVEDLPKIYTDIIEVRKVVQPEEKEELVKKLIGWREMTLGGKRRRVRVGCSGYCNRYYKAGHIVKNCCKTDKSELPRAPCFECGSCEHMRKDCERWQQKITVIEKDQKCFVCQATGHMSYRCTVGGR